MVRMFPDRRFIGKAGGGDNPIAKKREKKISLSSFHRKICCRSNSSFTEYFSSAGRVNLLESLGAMMREK
jgi:hypothetical protein